MRAIGAVVTIDLEDDVSPDTTRRATRDPSLGGFRLSVVELNYSFEGRMAARWAQKP